MPDYTEYLTPERLAVEDEAWSRTRHYARNGQAVLDALARLKYPGSVVEFGAGTGWLARYILPHVTKYLGVEKHAAAVNLARERVRRSERATLLCSDVREFSVPPRSYDVACAFAFLKHFGEPEWRVILRKLLSCAAHLAVFEVNVSSDGQLVDENAGRLPFPALRVLEGSVEAVLAEAGFRVVERTVWASDACVWETLFIAERAS